jgi:hypothetical protein
MLNHNQMPSTPSIFLNESLHAWDILFHLETNQFGRVLQNTKNDVFVKSIFIGFSTMKILCP